VRCKLRRCEYVSNAVDAPGRRILDFGSGGGLLASYLAATGASEVVGVELYEPWRDVAAYVAKDVFESDKARFVPSLDDLGEDETFDALLLTNVISHFYPPIELLLRLTHLMEPGGWLFIEDNNNMQSPVERLRNRRLVEEWVAKPSSVREARFGPRDDAGELAQLTYGMTYEQAERWADAPRPLLEEIHKRLRRRAPLNPEDKQYFENSFHPAHLRTILMNSDMAVWWTRPKSVFDFKRRPAVSTVFRLLPGPSMYVAPAYEVLALKL
jgi:SAM-dependent methyltransferase